MWPRLVWFLNGAVQQRLFVLKLINEGANVSGVEDGRRKVAIVLETPRRLPRMALLLLLLLMMVVMIMATMLILGVRISLYRRRCWLVRGMRLILLRLAVWLKKLLIIDLIVGRLKGQGFYRGVDHLTRVLIRT